MERSSYLAAVDLCRVSNYLKEIAMSRTRIYLVRHGQVEGFEEKRYNGHADVALTPEGEAQFEILKMRLQKKPLKAIYSSDLGRCQAGAQTIAAGHGLAPVFDPALRELHIGDWEGQTWQQLQAAYPQQWQARLADIVNYRVPNGESLLDLAQRVRPALAKIVAAHPGEDVLVVGHGGVNRVILLDVLGANLDKLFNIEQSYGCLNIIDFYPDGHASVQLLNG
jgi:alpha-ribazole phosphatase/probable phosphoglycerate mutase